MLHAGVVDKSDLHCSLAVFTWLFLRHIVTTCISEQTVISILFFMYIFLVLLHADCLVLLLNFGCSCTGKAMTRGRGRETGNHCES